MLTDEQREAWDRDGFFILRGFSSPGIGQQMAEELIAAIRQDPPAAHPGKPAYFTKDDYLIQPEAKPMPGAKAPEDLVAKLMNAHLGGMARSFATESMAGDIVADLLGPNIDVFQSQFIFKNPGAWGQPWHQDSYYFPFDQQPQVGLWLAISEATLENGCLCVLPGSHAQDILPHDPDPRPGANQGYLEVMGVDNSNAVPVLMDPGDLLVFHSYLLHKSFDNQAASRRLAMVYHFGRAGTKATRPLAPVQERILRWVPVRRGKRAA